MPFTCSGTLAAYYATNIFRPFSDRFQSIDFRENGLKNGLNVSDRFKTERKSAFNIYPKVCC